MAIPLSEIVIEASPRERIWLAEHGETLAGFIAVVESSPETAPLRWFLVAPECRDSGLGRRRLREAISFCRETGHTEIMLWIERSLIAAAHLYRAEGFRKVEEKPVRLWGTEIVEERYEMRLG